MSFTSDTKVRTLKDRLVIDVVFILRHLGFLFKAQIQSGEYHQADLDRLKSDKNNAWMRAFAKHGFDNFDKTVAIMNDVLKWRKDFGANELLVPGKFPFGEELFTRGAMFKRNVDKQMHSLCKFGNPCPELSRNRQFISQFSFRFQYF